MKQDQKLEFGIGPLFDAWTKSVTGFWDQMAKMQNGSKEDDGKAQKGHYQKFQRSVEFGSKMFQTVISMMSEPENLEALLKGTDTLPEFVTTISQNLWDSYFDLQKQWVEKASRIGQHTKAYSFDDTDREIFHKIREIYEKEFQKYFHVPQIGLTRFYQERVNKVADKFNLYQNALSELLYMFYVPIEKSFAVMQEKFEQMLEQGEVHDNFKEYYNAWIKVLEGHYMTLLQSPEYTQALDNTLTSLTNYKKVREEMLYDLLKDFPIPTNKEMDELYKEFYLLKKKFRELSKKVAQFEKESK
jgi:hypothetical protein